jgi:hypothetical protein
MAKKPKKLSRRAQRRLAERKPRECLFCADIGGLTEQHVFDDWLGNLGLGSNGIRELHEPESGRRVLQPGGPFSKKIRVVCEPCNGIWLSSMEQAAKDPLMEIFRSQGQQVRLDEGLQLTLARWAFKMVCVLSQMGPQKTFPLQHCREFRQSSLPPAQVQIWLGSASIRLAEHGAAIVESRFEPRIANLETNGRKLALQCYSARFRLLNVVFDVFGHVPDKFDPRAVPEPIDFGLQINPSENLRSALLPIWPAENPTIWWPPARSLDAIGGIDGLASVPLVGVPAVISSANAPRPLG